MKRNASIELLRIGLMFGICMCHSVGAGVYKVDAVRNICMMCTVGFVFLSGWFGVRFSIVKMVRLIGIAAFALGVTILEDYLWHGALSALPISRIGQWWFLNDYLMLMLLSPILNCIVAGLTSSEANLRRDAYIAVCIVVGAIYCLSWPMHCKWLPARRIFLTIGSPCSFGTMCAIYLGARAIRVLGFVERLNTKIALTFLLISCGLAIVTHKFSYYNSPIALIFSIALFYLASRVRIQDGWLARLILRMSPSMFFVYLYHSHGDPGFAILKALQGKMVTSGMPIVLAWIGTASIIFFVGLLIDTIRRVAFERIVR